MEDRITRHTVSTGMPAGCALGLIALGLCFAFQRPPLLPEDPRFMGTILAQVRADVPMSAHPAATARTERRERLGSP